MDIYPLTVSLKLFPSKNGFTLFNDPFKKYEFKSFFPNRNYTPFNEFT